MRCRRVRTAPSPSSTRRSRHALPGAHEGCRRGRSLHPLVRSFAGNMVRVRIQAGAHEEEFNATVHGVKWLQGGSGFAPHPTPAGAMPRPSASPSSSP